MRLMQLVAVLSAGFLMASTALTQQPPGGRGTGAGFGGGGLVNSIARSKELQGELKIDADQVEKLTAALTKAREENRESTQKLFTPGITAEERTEITNKTREVTDKAVASVLKPEQVKRMKQLEAQQAGINVFTRTELAKPLNLTDEQKERITKITTELASDRRQLQQGAGGAGGRGGFGRPDPEMQKKLASLQQEAMENATKVLTDEQAKAFKEMTGERFEFPANLAQGGGFGGGGQPGGGFGAGGFGGFGGGGQPGTVLSTGSQTTLKLTEEQKKELEQIQKDVDARLEKMLTEEQRTQLKQMRERQPGGFGTQPGGRGRTQPKKDN